MSRYHGNNRRNRSRRFGGQRSNSTKRRNNGKRRILRVRATYVGANKERGLHGLTRCASRVGRRPCSHKNGSLGGHRNSKRRRHRLNRKPDVRTNRQRTRTTDPKNTATEYQAREDNNASQERHKLLQVAKRKTNRAKDTINTSRQLNVVILYVTIFQQGSPNLIIFRVLTRHFSLPN